MPNKVLYHPAHVRHVLERAMRYAKEAEELSDDIRALRDLIREERKMMREELRAAWTELRRLQAIDAACHSERDIFAPLN